VVCWKNQWTLYYDVEQTSRGYKYMTMDANEEGEGEKVYSNRHVWRNKSRKAVQQEKRVQEGGPQKKVIE